MLCGRPEIEEQAKVRVGRNSQKAVVSVSSSVGKIKPCLKRGNISKLGMWLRGFLLVGVFKKCFPVHSINKQVIIRSQG